MGEPCYCQQGEAPMVAVSASGEFFVRDGKVIEVIEAELVDSNDEFYAYTVWIDREDDDDD